jgi:hypothetical protein
MSDHNNNNNNKPDVNLDAMAAKTKDYQNVTKAIREFGNISTEGNGKDKPKHLHYVQKYTKPGLMAEAVIVGGIPSFAVSRAAKPSDIP